MSQTPRRLAGETFVFEDSATTNSGFVNGVLIDTGPHPTVYDEQRVEHVVITHGHADHFSSAAELRRRGARITAPRRTRWSRSCPAERPARWTLMWTSGAASASTPCRCPGTRWDTRAT